MHLLLYLNDKLVDIEPLNLTHLKESKERDGYMQGAMQLLLEKWSDALDEPGVEPRFELKLDIGELL